MNRNPSGRRQPAGTHASDESIDRDLSAYASETIGDPTDVHESVRRARNHASNRGGNPMAALRLMWMRPTVPTLVAVAIGLFVVFGLPISYERTVGHDVELTVSGQGLDQSHIMALANQMKSALNAPGVRVRAEASADDVAYELTASMPGRSARQARSAANALVGTLVASGFEASANVKARTERASGTVYAFASDRILRISTDGKSAGQIEAEIRDGLAAAGFSDAQVSVSDEGEGKKRVEVRAEREGTAGAVEGEIPQIVLTENGRELGGEVGECTVRVKKVREDGGAEKLVVDIAKDGRTVTVEIPNADSAGDAAIQSAIQDELDRAGIDARAEVQGGRISVEAR